MSNWKEPVFQARDSLGNWSEDSGNESRFFDYSCTMPSGQTIERSARFFSRMGFENAIDRWNRNGNGMYKYTAIDNKAVNERPR